jgi:hypothetical protein
VRQAEADARAVEQARLEAARGAGAAARTREPGDARSRGSGGVWSMEPDGDDARCREPDDGGAQICGRRKK